MTTEKNMKQGLTTLVIIFGISCQIMLAAEAETSTMSAANGPPYSLAVVLSVLNSKGQYLFDVEQGQFLPNFNRIDLDGENYLDALKDLLATQNYAYEMRGPVMVIYDKKLRAMGTLDCPLNLKISSAKLSNVSLDQCFAELGKQLHINILYGGLVSFTPAKPPTNFDIDLENITLREALFKIVKQSKSQIWSAAMLTIGNKRFLQISIQ